MVRPLPTSRCASDSVAASTRPRRVARVLLAGRLRHPDLDVDQRPGAAKRPASDVRHRPAVRHVERYLFTTSNRGHGDLLPCDMCQILNTMFIGVRTQPTVVIQTSFGNRTARAHWAEPWTRRCRSRTRGTPAPVDRRNTNGCGGPNPDGSAQFWGTTGKHDRTMDQLDIGDIVLFTGKKRVRAVGEVGCSFRNHEFANRLWEPDPDRGSRRNVYSLIAFQPTSIPYEEIWELPSFNWDDNFRQLRLLRPGPAAEVLEGLAITPTTAALVEQEQESVAAKTLSGGTSIIEAEAIRTPVARYRQEAKEVLVHRTEALLVDDYRTKHDLPPQRISTPAGLTDLHVQHPDGDEIVEAKSFATHQKVRDAVAQLLDYAPFSPRPLVRLTALFLTRPVERDLNYLHRLCIDCVFMAGGTYQRLPAPKDRREAMRSAWTDTQDD